MDTNDRLARGSHAPAAPLAGRLIAIAGGKGGVGKSCVAVNVALALGQLGRRVVLIDADLGAANLHTMLGITRPASGLADFLDHEGTRLDAVAIPTASPSLRLIAGTSRPGSANLDRARLIRLMRGFGRIDADDVVIDVGAGTSFATLDMVAVADIKVIVVTPQLTSLQNAYAFLKALVHRTLRGFPDAAAERETIDRVLGHEGEAGMSIPGLIAELRTRDPALARHVVTVLGRMGVVLVGNMLSRDGDAAMIDRISRMIYDHLLLHAPVVGAIRMTPAVALALTERVPVVLSGVEVSAAPYRRVAQTVADIDIARLRGSIAGRPSRRTIPIWIERDAGATPRAS